MIVRRMIKAMQKRSTIEPFRYHYIAPGTLYFTKDKLCHERNENNLIVHLL